MSDNFAYIIPAIVLYGVAFQKNLQIYSLALEANQKPTVFYFTAIITASLNIITLVCYSALEYYNIAPFEWKSKGTVNFIGVFAVAITNLANYMVILFRLPVVQSNSFARKLFYCSNVLGLIVHLITFVANGINFGLVMLGYYDSIYSTPYTTMNALSVFVNSFFQAFNFISASFLFIFSIAKDLGIQTSDLYTQLFIKYALFDYLILAFYKLYTCFALLVLLKNHNNSDDWSLFGTEGAVVVSPIYSSFVFFHSSFKAPKHLLRDYSVATYQIIQQDSQPSAQTLDSNLQDQISYLENSSMVPRS